MTTETAARENNIYAGNLWALTKPTTSCVRWRRRVDIREQRLTQRGTGVGAAAVVAADRIGTNTLLHCIKSLSYQIAERFLPLSHVICHRISRRQSAQHSLPHSRPQLQVGEGQPLHFWLLYARWSLGTRVFLAMHPSASLTLLRMRCVLWMVRTFTPQTQPMTGYSALLSMANSSTTSGH